MTEATLAWSQNDGGVAFVANNAGLPESTPVSTWQSLSAITLPNGQPARIGPLLRLLDELRAQDLDDGSLLVPWAAIAELTDNQLSGLGLPLRSRVGLSLKCQGALTDVDFRVPYSFIDPDGFALGGVRRTGCLLQVGNRPETLPQPLYGIVDALDQLNYAPPGDRTERMIAWGRVADMLPKEVGVDDYLRTFCIRVIDAFEIEPKVNESGEPDFDPVPGAFRSEIDETGEQRRLFRTDLPPGSVQEFAKRFRVLKNVKANQALVGNTYVVLPTRVLQALTIAKSIQQGPAAQRAEFLRRPAAFIREGFEQAGVEVDVDEVLWDQGLSDRVRGVGLWQPKVLPWIQRPTESWMPPERIGLILDSQRFEIDRADIPDLRKELEQAKAEGRASVSCRDQTIPATDQAIDAVSALVGALDGASGPQPRQGREKIVLLVKENLDELSHRSVAAARPGAAGEAPKLLKATLLPHQRAGLEWLLRHWLEGSTGALLADDMGLGKSLQALAFLAWLRESAAGVGPFLLVAPTGLLNNWLDEHRKHLHPPGLGEAVQAYGSTLKRLRRSADKELQAGAPALDYSRLRDAAWVLTTYETLRDYQHSFARVRWGAAVFDEAQKVKNPSAGVTDAAMAMSSGFNLMMTGTPVENRPADIWPLLDIAQPAELGTLKDFSRAYESEEAGSRLDQLNQLLLNGDGRAPVMLRRMKEDHVDGLPQKIVDLREVPMPQVQAAAYADVIERGRSGRAMLEVLQAMRAVSLHPDAGYSGGIDAFIAASARLAETFRILNEIKEAEEKALIFCEALELQDFLAEALPKKFRLSGPVGIINGNVPGVRRQEIVDRFQRRPQGFDVMILSPRAGGVGLTITAANHVIHLSRWWNPAVEDQCSDRVYRIGQEKPVTIHLPISRHPEYGEHTFDVRLNELLERKRGQNRAVLAPPATSKRDLDDLYRATLDLDPAN